MVQGLYHMWRPEGGLVQLQCVTSSAWSTQINPHRHRKACRHCGSNPRPSHHHVGMKIQSTESAWKPKRNTQTNRGGLLVVKYSKGRKIGSSTSAMYHPDVLAFADCVASFSWCIKNWSKLITFAFILWRFWHVEHLCKFMWRSQKDNLLRLDNSSILLPLRASGGMLSGLFFYCSC